MLYGWKENSMLTNCLAACADLTITVSEIQRYICEKIVILSYTLAFDAPVRGGGYRQNIGTPFNVEKLEWCRYPMVKKFRRYLFVLTWSTNVTDGQTDTAWQQRPRLCIASRGKNRRFHVPQPTFLFPLEKPLRLSRNCMAGKTIQCLPNPSQHVLIYLQ